MKLRTLLQLAGAIALPLVVGGLSGMATADAIPTWYAGVEKPSFNPPSWVFAPVWTVLYVMMGVASFLVARAQGERAYGEGAKVRAALTLYGVQLLLNGLWSLLFFGLGNPGLALVEILVLLVFIAATTRAFARLDAAAGWLMAPYLAWVSFATVLNASIWWLNRG